MIRSGTLNTPVLSLITRFGLTNALVIADRAFAFLLQIEMIDISLADGLPAVNQEPVLAQRRKVLGSISDPFKDHEEAFKKRVPGSLGLIRTGDTTHFSNTTLVSA